MDGKSNLHSGKLSSLRKHNRLIFHTKIQSRFQPMRFPAQNGDRFHRLRRLRRRQPQLPVLQLEKGFADCGPAEQPANQWRIETRGGRGARGNGGRGGGFVRETTEIDSTQIANTFE